MQKTWMKRSPIAGRIPGARKGTVEIRPAVELGNLPEMNLAGVTRENN